MREISFAEAIAEATIQTMEENKHILLFGEGVDDPKGAFGTTLPVFKKFGGNRVFDTPLSESALTGVAVGAAMGLFSGVMITAFTRREDSQTGVMSP